MALVVYVDDVLLFGPDETNMEKVLKELQSADFDLKLEKPVAESTNVFLGINVNESTVNSKREVKLAQHGFN